MVERGSLGCWEGECKIVGRGSVGWERVVQDGWEGESKMDGRGSVGWFGGGVKDGWEEGV